MKEYCTTSWLQVLDNRVSLQDFIFAKEVRMGTYRLVQQFQPSSRSVDSLYSDKVPPPPGVTVAARRMVLDPTDEPQYGERIRYVITRGAPNSRLVDRAVAPHEVLDKK